MPALPVRAIRGATKVPENSRDAILESTVELLQAIIDKNRLSADEIISIIFTSTEDLTAEFPAVAARRLGLQSVPLLCSKELSIEGAMERVIRVLLHVESDSRSPNHVYLGEARSLREDIN